MGHLAEESLMYLIMSKNLFIMAFVVVFLFLFFFLLGISWERKKESIQKGMCVFSQLGSR